METTRGRVRHDYYEAAVGESAWRLHPLGAVACPWPLWEAVDEPDGLRVAVTAGFAGPTGHNNLRAPFLGSDLQNTLLYVPITTDGSIVDLASPGAEDLFDEAAWLDRIEEERVDAVAVVAPRPPELAAIEANPDRFRLVTSSACGDQGALYQVVDSAWARRPAG